MPKTRDEKEIVINTGPIIALAAAVDDLRLLESLYQTVYVPHEVAAEIRAKGTAKFAVEQFNAARGLMILDSPVADMPPLLRNSLDLGEASVIQLDVPASNGIIHVIDNVLVPMDDMMMEDEMFPGKRDKVSSTTPPGTSSSEARNSALL